MSYKLPASQSRRRATPVQSDGTNTGQGKNALTEKQKDKVLDIAGDAAKDFGAVIKGLLDIHKIRANSAAAVATIAKNLRNIRKIRRTTKKTKIQIQQNN